METTLGQLAIAMFLLLAGPMILLPWLMIALGPVILLFSTVFLFISFIGPAVASTSRHSKLLARGEIARILLVDDEPTSLYPLLLALNSLSASVTVLTSGLEISSELARGKYDLLVIDQIMPEMNGIDALKCCDRELKQSGIGAIEVVFYTSSPTKFLPVADFTVFNIREVWSKDDSVVTLRNRFELFQAKATG